MADNVIDMFSKEKHKKSYRIAVFVDGANFYFMQQQGLGELLDLRKLLLLIEGYGEIVDAYYYTGQDVPPDAMQQGFFDALPHMGYTVIFKQIKTIVDHKTGQTFKKANLDVEIVLDMFNTIDTYDMAVLVSGDGDFERALQHLRSRGKRFMVIATAGFVASELRKVAGMHYIDLVDVFDQLKKD